VLGDEEGNQNLSVIEGEKKAKCALYSDLSQDMRERIDQGGGEKKKLRVLSRSFLPKKGALARFLRRTHREKKKNERKFWEREEKGKVSSTLIEGAFPATQTEGNR